ncbi:MAG TPA: hypothetical protein P5555_05320 [Candidatus Paceibacterota bacterium]|nr:hypothetical protein [Verrucomicrobiota bacterium]HRZ44593.1 hypothetical protein [Candidatus Paceibacterota bacterium]
MIGAFRQQHLPAHWPLPPIDRPSTAAISSHLPCHQRILFMLASITLRLPAIHHTGSGPVSHH